MMTTDESSDEPLEFEVEVMAVSEKALLVRLEDDAGDLMEIWLPKSQLPLGSEVKAKGEIGSVRIPTWLAYAKGIV